MNDSHNLSRSDLASAVKESRAPAISRAVAVLRLLGKTGTPMPLQGIARELGLVPSTCLYVLRSLVAEELVAFDPETKRYTLDAGILTLARLWLRRSPFAEHVQTMLDRVAGRFGVTVLGVQIVGLDHIIVVGSSQSASDFRVSTPIGSRFPALISATGRCIAAFGGFSDEELRRRFDLLKWDDPPSFDQWMAQVEQARRQEYGVDEGNYMSGVTVVAAPVWKGRGRPSHALVAIGLSRALEDKTRLADALVQEARALSRQLEQGSVA